MENNLIMDKALIRLSDKIICHNEKMKSVLVKMGKAPRDIVCLELFDYLFDGEVPERNAEPELSVVVAGRLSYTKSAYIYKAAEANPGVRFHFYGIDFDESRKSPNMEYHGSFPPEELICPETGSRIFPQTSGRNSLLYRKSPCLRNSRKRQSHQCL